MTRDEVERLFVALGKEHDEVERLRAELAALAADRGDLVAEVARAHNRLAAVEALAREGDDAEWVSMKALRAALRGTGGE